MREPSPIAALDPEELVRQNEVLWWQQVAVLEATVRWLQTDLDQL